MPGVGAFGAVMDGLLAARGPEVIERRLAGGRPVLGICVGMQVLFERGVEGDGEHGGARRVAGHRRPPRRAGAAAHGLEHRRRVPGAPALFAGIETERFYFVHSYAARELDDAGAIRAVAAPQVTWADHGGPFIAAVENGPLSATQFHPEKSGDAGVRLLANWLETL